ncbi:hypothetical protein [Rhizobium sp. AC44/96]|uniref:hypothetical protein n=2 Tax=unclassified Rhizobium TaxID=2613769 RepID=UPI0013011410|nr:hypothetical protein [Rhizobium sp. AC44/96]
MRDFSSSSLHISRPERHVPKRRMRERRTAQAMILFGVVLAAVELYVILGGFWHQ